MTEPRKKNRGSVPRTRGDGLRSCQGCQLAADPSKLIRLVVGEDGEIHVDSRLKGQGRGAWLCPRRSCLAEAVKRRRLERSLHIDGLHSDVQRLVQEALDGVEDRIRFLLSLCQKSGRAASGGDVVERLVTQGEVDTLLVSRDAAESTRKRVVSWVENSRGRIRSAVVPLDMEILGHVLGKSPRSVVAIRPGELCRAIVDDLARHQALCEDPGPVRAVTAPEG